MKNTPKVYLIKVPHEYHIHDRNWPLGLLYLSAYLRSKHIEVRIIDLSGLPEENWNLPRDGGYYGVSCTTPDYHHAVKIAEHLKNTTKATVILGGVHATARSKQVLETSCFDIVVKGEGEQSFFEIVDGKKLTDINGISFTMGEEIVENPPRALIKDLDSLPPPSIEDLDYKQYVQPIIIKDSESYGIAMITARGCPYECIFCASKLMWQRNIRFHSVDYLVKQICRIKDLGINNFFFCDDTLLINKNRTKEFLSAISRLEINWRCSATTNKITPELAEALAASGCRQIDFGIESGSDRMLRIMKKASRVKQHIKATHITRDAGIMTKSMLMVGLPGETEGDIRETIRFVKESASDMFTVNVFVPLPGCEVAENPEQFEYEADPAIPYEQYFITARQKDTPIVHMRKKQVALWRDMVWEAIGEKSTLDVISQRDKIQCGDGYGR